MAVAKTKAQKYAPSVYPKDAAEYPQFNPDNYPLFKFPPAPGGDLKTDMKSLSGTIMVLTPEMCQTLIDHHFRASNSIREDKRWSEELAARASKGEFVLMSTFEFYWDSLNGCWRLADGHNRIRGLAKSNAVILARFVFGTLPSYYKWYDDNNRRTAGQLGGIEINDRSMSNGGEAVVNKKQSDILAAAAGWVELYNDGHSLEARSKSDKFVRGSFGPDHPEAVVYLKQIQATKANTRGRRGMHNAAKAADAKDSLLLVLYYLGSKVNKTRTKEFITGVVTPLGITDENDPRLVYRDWLSQSETEVKRNGGRMSTYIKLHFGLQALRYYLDGVSFPTTPSGRPKWKQNAKTGLPPKGGANVPRLSAKQDAQFAKLADVPEEASILTPEEQARVAKHLKSAKSKSKGKDGFLEFISKGL